MTPVGGIVSQESSEEQDRRIAGARQPSAPTVLQRARRGSSTPTVMQAPLGPAHRPDETPVFPDPLLDRFEPIEYCGSGSEGAVWRVNRRTPQDPNTPERGLKIYWAGQMVDQKLIAHLRDPAFIRHAPWIGESGHYPTESGSVEWVELEYLPWTFAELVAAQGDEQEDPDRPRAAAVVAELAEGIRFWQEVIKRNPLDYKPDNLLVRRDPDGRPQVVLADFGGATAFTASQTMKQALFSRAYAPPDELWNAKGSPWPWWSLGMITFEIITGHALFQAATDEALIYRIVAGRLPLDEVTDERWHLLLRGLLTKDPGDRWGYPQVRDWLDGGSPAVAEGYVAPAQREPGATEPIQYHGNSYADPVRLAGALTATSNFAAHWLVNQGGADRLLRWMRECLPGRSYDLDYLADTASRVPTADLAVTAFAAALAPGEPPCYQGRPVSADLLADTVSGPDGPQFARQVAERGVLAVAAQAACPHPDCESGGRCLVLDAAAAHIAAAIPLAQGHITRADAAPGSGQRRAADYDRMYQTATILAVDPGAAWRMRRMLRPWFGGPPWWQQARRQSRWTKAGSVESTAAIAAAAALTDRAVQEAAGAAKGSTSVLAELRGAVAHAPARIGETFFVALAAALLGWSAAVLRLMVDVAAAHRVVLVEGRAIGVTAGALQARYLGLDLFAAILAVLVAHGIRRPAPLLLVPMAAAAACGVPDRVPLFPAITPNPTITRWLTQAGEFWNRSVGFGAALFIVVGLVAAAWAVHLARSQGGLPRRPNADAGGALAVRTRALVGQGGYLAGFLILFVTLVTLAWATVLAHAMLIPPHPLGTATVAGDGPARLNQATLTHGLVLVERGIPLLLLLAAAVCAASRQWGRWPLPVAAAAVCFTAWRGPNSLPLEWGTPLFAGDFAGVDSFWGGELFWAALGCAVVALCFGLWARVLVRQQ
jgi:hypothetical protein